MAAGTAAPRSKWPLRQKEVGASGSLPRGSSDGAGPRVRADDQRQARVGWPSQCLTLRFEPYRSGGRSDLLQGLPRSPVAVWGAVPSRASVRLPPQRLLPPLSGVSCLIESGSERRKGGRDVFRLTARSGRWLLISVSAAPRAVQFHPKGRKLARERFRPGSLLIERLASLDSCRFGSRLDRCFGNLCIDFSFIAYAIRRQLRGSATGASSYCSNPPKQPCWLKRSAQHIRTAIVDGAGRPEQPGRTSFEGGRLVRNRRQSGPTTFFPRCAAASFASEPI
jgi:hypothetical protein